MAGGFRSLFVLAALLALVSAAAPPLAAQTMFKCKDGGGRVTYSNIPCEKQALKDAGVVADRTMTVPMGASKSVPAGTVPRPAGTSQPQARDKDETVLERPSTQVKPVVPLLERLVK